MKSSLIPFNEWSKERITQGRKICTSRHKKYLHDPRVIMILKREWWEIRNYFWELEGAVCPTELQEEIEKIYGREVPPNEIFYVHFGDFRTISDIAKSDKNLTELQKKFICDIDGEDKD